MISLAELARTYGWQLAFVLDWAQRQDREFHGTAELVNAYLSSIHYPSNGTGKVLTNQLNEAVVRECGGDLPPLNGNESTFNN